MAASKFQTRQFAAEDLVESAGAVLFHLSRKELCLVRHGQPGEWLLPKGRRNCAEHRHQAALREVQEETGYKCHVLPVTMKTRAPPAGEVAYPDNPRDCDNVREPFFLTTRDLGNSNIKLIWWFIAAVDESIAVQQCVQAPEDEYFEPRFFDYETAIEVLTFDLDKAIVIRAVELVNATYHQS